MRSAAHCFASAGRKRRSRSFAPSSGPGQGDGRAAPPVPRQPAEDRRSAEGQMRVGRVLAALRCMRRAERPVGVTFENVAAAIGLTFTHINGASAEKYLVETMGSGAAFLDYDNDGWIDLFVVDGGSVCAGGTGLDIAFRRQARHRLFRQRGRRPLQRRDGGSGSCIASTAWAPAPATWTATGAPTSTSPTTAPTRCIATPATARSRTSRVRRASGWTAGARAARSWTWIATAIWICSWRTTSMRRRARTRSAATRSVAFACTAIRSTTRVLPSVLYRNDGKGVFTDVSAEAGIARYVGNGLGVAVGDYDDDGWPDVFVANDAVPNFLFHNDGKGRFSEVALAAGVAVGRDGKARAGMGTEFADYNGDGRLDLSSPTTNSRRTACFATTAAGRSRTRRSKPASPHPRCRLSASAWRSSMPTTTATRISRSSMATSSTTPPSSGLDRLTLSEGCCFTRERPALCRGGPAVRTGLCRAGSGTDAARRRHRQRRRRGSPGRRTTAARSTCCETLPVAKRNALVVRVVGTRSNRNGIGARVTMTAQGRTQMREVKSGSSYLGQSDLRIHFGVGEATRVERLDIRWPTGGDGNDPRCGRGSDRDRHRGQGDHRAPVRR